MSYLLIIDDDDDFAMATATVLRNSGYEVETKLDITNATKSMEKRCPDLIILDVMFPESDSAGFELTRTIKNYNEKLKNIPIIMLSAVNTKFPLGFSSQDIDDFWLPVEEFIEKPVDFEILLKKVSALLLKDKETVFDH